MINIGFQEWQYAIGGDVNEKINDNITEEKLG
jgi:hypothetical protein